MSVTITTKHIKGLIVALFGVAISFYIFEGHLINSLILWTILPIYFGLLQFYFAYKYQSKKKLYGVYGFFILSLGFSYFYHLSWYFNVEGIVTSSSTSSLIFIIFPIYAVILGYIGYFLGTFISVFFD